MATYELFPSISAREKADATATEDVDSNPECGYNGCARTVDDPSLRCWQHRPEEN